MKNMPLRTMVRMSREAALKKTKRIEARKAVKALRAAARAGHSRIVWRWCNVEPKEVFADYFPNDSFIVKGVDEQNEVERKETGSRPFVNFGY